MNGLRDSGQAANPTKLTTDVSVVGPAAAGRPLRYCQYLLLVMYMHTNRYFQAVEACRGQREWSATGCLFVVREKATRWPTSDEGHRMAQPYAGGGPDATGANVGVQGGAKKRQPDRGIPGRRLNHAGRSRMA